MVNTSRFRYAGLGAGILQYVCIGFVFLFFDSYRSSFFPSSLLPLLRTLLEPDKTDLLPSISAILWGRVLDYPSSVVSLISGELTKTRWRREPGITRNRI
jgi:hypothetical protein